MIQRIQSIWLLLAAAACFLTLKLPFYNGNVIQADQSRRFEHLTAMSNIWLMILTFLLGTGILVIIFLFKDRKLQMRLTIVAILLSIVNIVLFFGQLKKFVEGSFDLTSPVVFIVPVFLILAARGIYRDQKLIKSLNRLR
jgi:glucan phosphoethanolaminetransferase (alkaline phosphatase superfamily)